MARVVMTCRQIGVTDANKEYHKRGTFDETKLTYHGEFDGAPDSSEWTPIMVKDQWALREPSAQDALFTDSELSELTSTPGAGLSRSPTPSSRTDEDETAILELPDSAGPESKLEA